MPNRSFLATALTLAASPTFADITADDVWNNRIALVQAFGGTIDATLERDGNMLFVNDILFSYALPFEAGAIRSTLPPMTMIEQDDGTVSIIYPKKITYRFELDYPSLTDEKLSGEIQVEQAELKTSASGVAGALTYQQSAGAYSGKFNVDLGDDATDNGVGMSMIFSGESYSHTTTVNEGELIEIVSSISYGPQGYELEANEGFGTRSVDKGRYGALEAQARAAFPARGLDVLNLSTALRDGMFIQTSQSMASSSGEQTDYINNDAVVSVDHTCGTSSSTVNISADGVLIDSLVDDCSGDFVASSWMDLAGLNSAIKAQADRLSMSLNIPLLSTDTPTNAKYQMGIGGANISDNIWDRFDPGGILSRDKMDMNIDLSADITHNVEWLDFLNIENGLLINQNPVELHNLTINAFDLSAAGASIESKGAFTFDMNDLDTFDGMPRPAGAAEILLTGVHELLDNLVSIGVVASQDVTMPRMMIGMFTRDDGNGTLTTSVEINDDGEIRMNGERVK